MLSDGRPEATLAYKLLHASWSLVFLQAAIACVGFAMLYSAANGSWEPWAQTQMYRFAAGFAIMLGVAVVDIRTWMRHAYTLYGLGIVLLLVVELYGVVGMGAQRWIDLGVITLQPSEPMKIFLILALARYFHGAALEDVRQPLFLLVATLIVAVPVLLVVKQPDLGTGAILAMIGAALFLLGGVPGWLFFAGGGLGLASLPVIWQFLHPYQKERVMIFLNPQSEPLGSGYHITQSKIALGSGGVFGKGFLEGSQSHLNFLPEKQTDFIFTMLAEEFGLVGALGLFFLYALVIVLGFVIAFRCRHQFGRLLALGVTTNFFLYTFINIAMVTGVVPVVGVPLPLVSYGGTAMLTIMFGFGLLMSAHIHRDVPVSRHGAVAED